MSAWSVMIVAGSPYAKFVPDAFSQSGALRAAAGDLVSWNNQTDDVHQPYATDASFKPTGPALSDPVGPWTSSSPGYVIAANAKGTTIYYACAYHPAEQGTLEVDA